MAIGSVTFVFVCIGVLLFYTPSDELMYWPARLVVPSGEDTGTIVFYAVEAGNTGRAELESVEFCFSKDALSRTAMPVTVRNFGASERAIAISNEVGMTVVSLGKLEPKERVNIYLALRYPCGMAPDEWEGVFLGARLSNGRARRGKPAMTSVDRAWFNLSGL